MSKVTLPREVAEAIEASYAFGFRSKHILLSSVSTEDIDDTYVLALRKYARKNFDVLLAALVNGYDVEKTPEEVIRDDYEQFDPGTLEYRVGLRDGIVRTLNTLGIKIEGVNVG